MCVVVVIAPHDDIAPKFVVDIGAKKIGVPAMGTGLIVGTVKTPPAVKLETAK